MNDNAIIVSEANDVERAVFYRKTYMHVAMAILAARNKIVSAMSLI